MFVNGYTKIQTNHNKSAQNYLKCGSSQISQIQIL